MRRRGCPNSPCCGGSVVSQSTCCPCNIPDEDLTLTYYSTGPAGNGSVTLTYTAGNPPSWRWNGCIDLGVGGTSGQANSLTFTGGCLNGSDAFNVEWYFQSHTCGTGSHNTLILTLTDYTCSPFHLHHHVNLASDGYPASDLLAFGFTEIYIDSSDSTQCGCLYKFNVTGCNSLGVPGATVDLWTNSGKTVSIGSCTTNSSGACTITACRFTNPYYEISHSRFTTASGTITGPSLSATTVALSIATGYHCIPGCGTPLPATLHATNSSLGAITLTYNGAGSLGAGWYGSSSYSYPGCYCCPSRTVTVNGYLDTTYGSYMEYWNTQ